MGRFVLLLTFPRIYICTYPIMDPTKGGTHEEVHAEADRALLGRLYRRT